LRQKDTAGQSQVHEGGPLQVYDHVGRFYVAMQDAVRVQSVEATADVDDDGQGAGHRQRPGLEERFKSRTRTPLDDQVKVVVTTDERQE
jgi:hypothetical protein